MLRLLFLVEIHQAGIISPEYEGIMQKEWQYVEIGSSIFAFINRLPL